MYEFTCLVQKRYQKKKAVIGAGLKEDSAGWMQIMNVLYTLRNIPATTIEYDSLGDKGSFVFDDAPAQTEPEEEVDPVTCGDNGGRNKRGNPCRTTAAEDPMVARNGRCKHHQSASGDSE